MQHLPLWPRLPLNNTRVESAEEPIEVRFVGLEILVEVTLAPHCGNCHLPVEPKPATNADAVR